MTFVNKGFPNNVRRLLRPRIWRRAWIVNEASAVQCHGWGIEANIKTCRAEPKSVECE